MIAGRVLDDEAHTLDQFLSRDSARRLPSSSEEGSFLVIVRFRGRN